MPIYTFNSEKNNDIKENVPNNFLISNPDSDTGYIKDLINTAPNIMGFKTFVLRENIGGFDFSSLALAVLSSDSAYVQKCKRFFRTVSVFAPDSFFCLADTKRTEEYTVFSFHCSGKEIPLSELKADKKAEYAQSIFRFLLKLIYSYANSLKEEKTEYIPLSCICEEAVYLNTCAKSDNWGIKLLPVFVSHEDKSQLCEKFPMDLWLGRASIASDIYSAAYLYSSLKGGLDETNPLDKLAEDCLNPKENQRPSIEALITALGDTTEVSPAPVFVDVNQSQENTDDRIITFKGKEKAKKNADGGIFSRIKNFLVTEDALTPDNKTKTSEVKKDGQ